jgi:hypothetical protein
VRLDRVYEAKMMFGLQTLIDRNAFPNGTTVVALLA